MFGRMIDELDALLEAPQCSPAAFHGVDTMVERIEEDLATVAPAARPFTRYFQSTLLDNNVGRCVLDIFNTLKFPKPQGDIVTVRYPILFSPAPDEEATASDAEPSVAGKESSASDDRRNRHHPRSTSLGRPRTLRRLLARTKDSAVRAPYRR